MNWEKEGVVCNTHGHGPALEDSFSEKGSRVDHVSMIIDVLLESSCSILQLCRTTTA